MTWPRDGREPSVVGLGVVDALSGSAPEVVIVMGAPSRRAPCWGMTQRWGRRVGAGRHSSGHPGAQKARVTHHPEAIIALAARGEAGAKREAFEDLKAVMTDRSG